MLRPIATMSRLQELFAAASALVGKERDRFLREHCANAPALREQVEELLRCDHDGGYLAEERLMALRAGLAGEAEVLPERIGPFRILGVLGHGGMGVVYRAEQQEPRREVALKVLAAGGHDASARARFALEVEALGRLQHPGIAQIFAADVLQSPAGARPFLAMELVRGEPLQVWAQRVKPPLVEQLRVLLEIADAVHHAHQRGVIHRDLKPGNVLVNERGRAKVLDFGIARLSDHGGAPSTLAGQLLGTLAYMSPEQAAGDADRIDVRSDVYSLAVLGYQLLAGALPIDVTPGSLTAGLQRITSEPPVPLGGNDRRLRGDLETIFACALRKEPERRYDSMSAFADDLRRHLAHEPIRARPPSLAYRLSRFVRRQALPLLAVTAVILGLCIALYTSMEATARVEAARAGEEVARKAAERSAEAARREQQLKADILDVLGEVFGTANPQENPEALHQPLAVRLQAALGRLEGRFRDSPATERRVRFELARTLHGRGEYGPAAQQLQRVRELLADAEPQEAQAVLLLLAQVRWRATDLQGALQVLDELAPRLRDEPPTAQVPYAVLRAQVLEKLGRQDEAQALLRTALAQCDADDRLKGRAVAATVRASLAAILFGRGEARESTRLVAEAAAILRDQSGADAEEALSLLNTQAVMAFQQGRFEEAAAMIEHVLASWEHVFGADHPALASLLQNQAAAKVRLGRLDEAAATFGRALALTERLHGGDSPELCPLLANLGALRKEQQDLDGASALYERALAIRAARLPAADKLLSGYLYDLAKIRLLQGRKDEHLALLERSVRVRSEALGPFHELVLGRRVELADQLGQAGRRAEAIAELRAIDGKMVEVLGRTHKAAIAAPRLLATFLLDERQPADVPACLQAMRERATGTPQAAATERAATELAARLQAQSK